MFKWCQNSQFWWIEVEVFDFEQKDGYIKITSCQTFDSTINVLSKVFHGIYFYIAIFLFKVEHLWFNSPKLGVPTPLEHYFLKHYKYLWRVDKNFLPKHEFLRDFMEDYKTCPWFAIKEHGSESWSWWCQNLRMRGGWSFYYLFDLKSQLTFCSWCTMQWPHPTLWR